MKLYRKDNMTSTSKIDDTWEEFEDDVIQTPIGIKLKSELGTQTFKEQLNKYELVQLRQRREQECFLVINRGQIWYDTLTEEQKEELKEWYQLWLDVTETKIVPERPIWLK